MRNEGTRKTTGEQVVYMVYDWKNGTETNYKEIFDFINRWAKNGTQCRCFRNRTSSVSLVWDDAIEEFIALKIGYHIIIDRSGHVRIFNQATFEKFYGKYVPENVEYVFFNG